MCVGDVYRPIGTRRDCIGVRAVPLVCVCCVRMCPRHTKTKCPGNSTISRQRRTTPTNRVHLTFSDLLDAIRAISHTRRHQQSCKCDGSLINSNTVLTDYCRTRSCALRKAPYYMQLSEHNTQEFLAHRLITHENYSTTTLLDDIAMIR